MSEYTIPQLAKDTWKRFGQWYGVDAIERKFGNLKPPPDWCMSIVLIGKAKIDLVLAQVKTKYPNFLPSLPEFEQLAEPFARSTSSMPNPNRPSTQYLLSVYVLKRFALSRAQLAKAWTYLYAGNPHAGSTDFAITGVIVPADDTLPAIRVLVSDVDLDALWAERAALEHRRAETTSSQTVQTPLPLDDLLKAPV